MVCGVLVARCTVRSLSIAVLLHPLSDSSGRGTARASPHPPRFPRTTDRRAYLNSSLPAGETPGFRSALYFLLMSSPGQHLTRVAGYLIPHRRVRRDAHLRHARWIPRHILAHGGHGGHIRRQRRPDWSLRGLSRLLALHRATVHRMDRGQVHRRRRLRDGRGIMKRLSILLGWLGLLRWRGI